MTRSIKAGIYLEKLSVSARRLLNARILEVGHLAGNDSELYAMPASELGPGYSGNRWEVWCPSLCDPAEASSVPYHIKLDLNAPKAMIGKDADQGVSGTAAGSVVLELVRIWLAKNGLPREEIDLLTTFDVNLEETTIAYRFDCATKTEADELMGTIWATACTLYRNCDRLRYSTDGFITIPGKGFMVVVTPEANFASPELVEGGLDTTVVNRAPYCLQFEVRLRPEFLGYSELVFLDMWDHEGAQALHKELFDATVGSLLRLNEGLRRRAPPPKVYGQLTEIEAALLRWVVKEGRDPAEFNRIAESRRPSALKSEMRRRILAIAQVDIDIPWKLHTKLRCSELANRLNDLGHCDLSQGNAGWCFRQGNWPEFLRSLDGQYEAALRA